MVLIKQTYNTQDKHKKPKQRTNLNQTNSGLVASYDFRETDRVYSNKKTQLLARASVIIIKTSSF